MVGRYLYIVTFFKWVSYAKKAHNLTASQLDLSTGFIDTGIDRLRRAADPTQTTRQECADCAGSKHLFSTAPNGQNRQLWPFITFPPYDIETSSLVFLGRFRRKIDLLILPRHSNFGKISPQFLRMGVLDPKTTPRSKVYRIYMCITLFFKVLSVFYTKLHPYLVYSWVYIIYPYT